MKAVAVELEMVVNWIGVLFIVGFVVELIVGVVGVVIILLLGYYEVFEDVCCWYSILFIVDEVMMGFGRIG